jgi:small subunit ribosomal protein S8
MPVTDPIGDLLTRMRNAQAARKPMCRAPWSGLAQKICELLKREGWLRDVRVRGEGIVRELEVEFTNERPPLQLKRVSTPGRRVYRKAEKLQPVLRGYGMLVVTTSRGVLSDAQAREHGVGGEVLCSVT